MLSNEVLRCVLVVQIICTILVLWQSLRLNVNRILVHNSKNWLQLLLQNEYLSRGNNALISDSVFIKLRKRERAREMEKIPKLQSVLLNLKRNAQATVVTICQRIWNKFIRAIQLVAPCISNQMRLHVEHYCTNTLIPCSQWRHSNGDGETEMVAKSKQNSILIWKHKTIIHLWDAICLEFQVLVSAPMRFVYQFVTQNCMNPIKIQSYSFTHRSLFHSPAFPRAVTNTFRSICSFLGFCFMNFRFADRIEYANWANVV